MHAATDNQPRPETKATVDALATAWPMVGRDGLVDRVVAAFVGGAAGVVLTGAAGVGKSRVARAILSQVALRGSPTEWVQATDASRDLPLGAFTSLLPAGADASTPLDLLRRTAAAVRGRARRGRLMLAVDDAHLTDPASATLVQQLAASGDVFVLATIRTGEEVPDAIVALWKERLADRIDVGSLDEADVGKALRVALGGEVEVATAHRLFSATRGNALYLHEVALAGVRSGTLHRRDDLWCWRGPISGDGKLRDALEARLAPLAPERAALELLAVGEPVGVDVFERVVGITVVDDLERQELVKIRRDERREEASLAHPLYRDLLRAGMTAAAFAQAEEQLAQAVERAGGRRRGDALRVAMWRLTGPAEAQSDLLLAAATEAEARFDAELAERLARLALERDGGAEAWHAVAAALRAQGRNAEADGTWAMAFELETDPAARVAYAQSRSANLFFGSGEGPHAIAVLDAVYQDATTPNLRDTIASLVSMFDLYRGRIDSALAAAVPILEHSSVSSGARIDAALTAAAGFALRGRPDDAIGVVDANIAVALQEPGVGSIAAGALMATRLLALSLDGRLDEAIEGARIVYDLAVDMGTHDGIAGLSYAMGQILEVRGELDAARRHLAEGVALLREHDRNGYLPWCLAELAYVELLGGRIDDARATIAEVDLVQRHELRLFWPRVETVKLVLLGLDHPDDAVDGLVAVGTAATADGHLVLAAMALHEAIHLGGAAAVVDQLMRLAISTDSALVRAYSRHARAAADDDGDALDLCAATFESMGALIHAADAAAGAADAHERAGRNAARLAATQKAAALAGRCIGAAPPWRTQVDDGEPLSARQLEVAALAARGLSSREIADRLFVSVRTVDNHLYRIFAKLGVQRRDELGIALGLDGPNSE